MSNVQIKDTGAWRFQVIAAFGIPLGILGAIIGVAILLKLTQEIVAQLILDAEQGMPLVVSPLVIGLTVLFSAATILLSAWVPARRASRVSPIDAIRQSGEIQEDKPLNLRTSPLIRRVFGFEGELALKSLQRDRKRYLTTLLSLMMSIILFVAFNALQADAPNLGAEVFEAFELVLVAAELFRADLARVERVEGEHERLAACGCEAEGRVLDGAVAEPDAVEGEVGGDVADLGPCHSPDFT